MRISSLLKVLLELWLHVAAEGVIVVVVCVEFGCFGHCLFIADVYCVCLFARSLWFPEDFVLRLVHLIAKFR